MKRIVTLIIALALLCLSTSVYALTIEPYYTYTASIDAQLSISSSGTATCSGEVTPRSSSNSASVVVVLEQKKNGNWSTFASWSGGSYDKGTKKLTAGYSYRVVVMGTVKSSSGTVLETPTKTTSVKSY